MLVHRTPVSFFSILTHPLPTPSSPPFTPPPLPPSGARCSPHGPPSSPPILAVQAAIEGRPSLLPGPQAPPLEPRQHQRLARLARRHPLAAAALARQHGGCGGQCRGISKGECTAWRSAGEQTEVNRRAYGGAEVCRGPEVCKLYIAEVQR